MAKVPEGRNALSSMPRLAAHISQRASGRRLYRSEQARTSAHEAWGRWAFVRGRADGRHRFASRQAPSWRIRSESGTRKFVAGGSTPRPGSRVASATLGHHHKPFGSARIARTPRALELVGACPRLVALDRRWQRQQESRRGWAIDTRLAPGACSGAPERPGIDATISQRQSCGPGTAHRTSRFASPGTKKTCTK